MSVGLSFCLSIYQNNFLLNYLNLFFFSFSRTAFGMLWIHLVWFGLVLWHTNDYRLFNDKSSLYIQYTLFGLVLWHINNCNLINFKSSLYIYIYIYIYIEYILFGLVWFGLILSHIKLNQTRPNHI